MSHPMSKLPTESNHDTEQEDLELHDEEQEQEQGQEQKKNKSSVVSWIFVTLILMGVLFPLGSMWWSTFGYASPLTPLETLEAGSVVEVSYLHGLGTRTQVKTAHEVFLLESPVRILVGTTVVVQRNAIAERLCIQGSDRCWFVVNRE